MYELPPHLQSLNAIPSTSSPSSSALSAEQEAEFWAFMNTDELFANFGLAPQAFESKKAESSRKAAESPVAKKDAALAPVEEAPSGKIDAPTLESFLATFAAAESNAATPLPSYNLMAALQPLTAASTPAPAATPADTPDVSAKSTRAAEEEAERVTGAKRLKMMGAGVAEIEEDKRRRNTEASARFRAKKKARERALEDRAKDLEAQVATLTAEKASLEKENNLLKFVIVNGQGSGGASADGLQAALAALGKPKPSSE